jgi:hypothetical protein
MFDTGPMSGMVVVPLGDQGVCWDEPLLRVHGPDAIVSAALSNLEGLSGDRPLGLETAACLSDTPADFRECAPADA